MDSFEEITELNKDTKSITEVMTDKELAKKTNEPFIGTWLEAPKFSRDNEYIKRGYRVNFNTIKRILRSLFMIHNESMNIWSHLLGVIMFLVFVGYIAIYLTPKISLINFNEQLQSKLNLSYLNNQFLIFNIIGMKTIGKLMIWLITLATFPLLLKNMLTLLRILPLIIL